MLREALLGIGWKRLGLVSDRSRLRVNRPEGPRGRRFFRPFAQGHAPPRVVQERQAGGSTLEQNFHEIHPSRLEPPSFKTPRQPLTRPFLALQLLPSQASTRSALGIPRVGESRERVLPGSHATGLDFDTDQLTGAGQHQVHLAVRRDHAPPQDFPASAP